MRNTKRSPSQDGLFYVARPERLLGASLRLALRAAASRHSNRDVQDEQVPRSTGMCESGFPANLSNSRPPQLKGSDPFNPTYSKPFGFSSFEYFDDIYSPSFKDTAIDSPVLSENVTQVVAIPNLEIKYDK